MINAKEARELIDTKLALANVTHSDGFKLILNRLDEEIRTAINNGLESIVLKTYLLDSMAAYKLPSGFNSKFVDANKFWFKYVKSQLEKLGFKIEKTMTTDNYLVSW